MRAAIRALLGTAVAFHVKRPYRFLRRLSAPWRIKPLPDGRSWGSVLSDAAHIAIMRGQLGYRYRGMKALRNPFDLCIYLMILQELKPRTVIEIGSLEGGHAAWLGDMLNVLDIPGRVYSIDVNCPDPKYQPFNVEMVRGDENHLEQVDLSWHRLPHPWFVIQDASHHYAPLLNSLSFLNKYMVSGDRLIVEDGYITQIGEDGHARHGGPARAIAEFLANAKDWRIEARWCDFFGYNATANANGYLVKL